MFYNLFLLRFEFQTRDLPADTEICLQMYPSAYFSGLHVQNLRFSVSVSSKAQNFKRHFCVDKCDASALWRRGALVRLAGTALLCLIMGTSVTCVATERQILGHKWRCACLPLLMQLTHHAFK